jgi:CHAT domain-containing protein
VEFSAAPTRFTDIPKPAFGRAAQHLPAMPSPKKTKAEARYMRVDTAFDHQVKATPKGAPKPDRAGYWQKLALAEFEQFVGREHPDTVRLLRDVARRQWEASGPEAAETTVRDAWTRATTLLADRVLAGLPEAQAYQFLEANRPPVDLLLSCYRATKREHGRDAYEAIWRGKALATKQLVEQWQLVHATEGRPELSKLVDELRATRQQLAQLSLSAPPGAAAEGRRQQLGRLTQTKEDLERELAKLSEPLRRTRDASRAGVADMVGRLPAGTAVVDFVERWEWKYPTNSSPPTGNSTEKDSKSGDALPVGSTWTGKKHRDQGNKTMPATLKVTERNGTSFKGEFTFDKDNVNAVAGTISEGKIEWRTTKVLKGNENQPTKGTINGSAIDATFNLVVRAAGGKTLTATGTIQLRMAEAAKETKGPQVAAAVKETRASDRWVKTRCYDAFVLRPTKDGSGWSVAWVSLGDADTLDRLLDDWTPGLRPGGRADGKVAAQVRDRLWSPLEASLAGCDRVILIPDGRLGQIPWGALPGRKADSYLIEDFAIGQAPYGQYVAHVLTTPTPEGNNFLVAGGIDYGPPGKWSPLKGTDTEARQLEQLRRGPNTVRLSGTDATKARLRELLPTQRYAHLATHGDFLRPAPGRDGGRLLAAESDSGGPVFDVSARNPLLLSMLVLAGANRPARTDERGLPVGSDSFLTAEEVMGMNLTRTELVVLSACETGVGRVRGDEGTFSLQRAFHVAGSRAVVASLWKVPDKATQALMTRFHENLWKGRDGKPTGKLDALREAQVWLMKEARVKPELLRSGLRPEDDIGWKPGDPVPPYYWAAFVLSGDWR